MIGVTGLNQFILGGLMVACLVAGLFFLKSWQVTRDRLFLLFCLAFWAFALSWAGQALIPPEAATRHFRYLLRLFAFVLIIAGIVDKNRRRDPG